MPSNNLNHLERFQRLLFVPVSVLSKCKQAYISCKCCEGVWAMEVDIFLLFFSSSLALYPSVIFLVFHHDMYPFLSVQCSCPPSSYNRISQVRFSIVHPPQSRSIVFLFFLVVCLPVTSLLTLYHPFLQHAIPFQSTFFNYGYTVRIFNVIINFLIFFYGLVIIFLYRSAYFLSVFLSHVTKFLLIVFVTVQDSVPQDTFSLVTVS